MKKKDFPITLLQAVKNLKSFIRQEVANCDLIMIFHEGLITMKVVDTDPSSTFYFSLTDCVLNRESIPLFSFECLPFNRVSTNVGGSQVKRGDAMDFFKQWKNIIIDYDNTILTAEEEMLKLNQDRFLQRFQIIDDDAERATFDLEQQLFLDEYLNNVIKQLGAYKAGVDEDSKKIEELIEDAHEIRSIITKETKKKVIYKLAKFWAKAQVVGLEVIKEVFVKYITELSVNCLGDNCSRPKRGMVSGAPACGI